MRAKTDRLAAGALSMLKLQDRRKLELEKGLPHRPAEEVLKASRKELDLEPLPGNLAKWEAPPPRKGGRAR